MKNMIKKSSLVLVTLLASTAGRIMLANGYPFNQVKVYQDGLAGWQKSVLGTRK